MIHSVENLYRFGIKVFLSESPDPDLHTFVPMFHRWIQTHAVDGLLIDVADYAAYGKVRSETFGSGPPASSTVMVAALVRPEFLVEVEAIVHVPGGS